MATAPPRSSISPIRVDLLVGLVDGFGEFSINGVSENLLDDRVINLGDLGPNIDLTFTGSGVFVVGGVVPEPSTWAMMLLGFAGLGFTGYRSSQRAHRRLV